MKKIISPKLVCLCLFTGISLSLPLSGQPRYTSKLLQDIAGQLSASCGVAIEQSGDIPVKILGSPASLFVHQSETKEIDHIGLKLFAPDMVEKQHTPIFHFVERYMLELLLTQTDADALQRLQMERIKLSSDIPMTGKLRKDLQNTIAAFSNRLSFLLSNAGNRYKLLCMDGNRTILSIEFPARYELITGYTKPEAENAVYMSLLTHKSTSVPQPAATDFREKEPGIYTTNDDYYMMENIVSTSYYTKEGDAYQPVFSQDRPIESVCNLFNSGIDYGATVEISQSLYGNKSHIYEIPLSRLTSYLRSQKCSLYTAIRKIEKDRIYGAWMAVNPELGYQHILTFTLDKSVIPEIKGKQVKLKMFSYVPIHNIASIIDNNQ